MKIELTKKELSTLIGLAYEAMNKEKELLNLIDSDINVDIDVKKIENDYQFFQDLYEKLGSQIEL